MRESSVKVRQSLTWPPIETKVLCFQGGYFSSPFTMEIEIEHGVSIFRVLFFVGS
jgi:hypothetical protein